MTITETRQEETVQLTLGGRVDVTTAPQLQNAILAAFQKGKHLILDFDAIEYISSAGLRALLIGQKTANSKGGSMKLVHVKPAVEQVFEVTGFIDMLTLE